jgi:hypothetical protein
MKKLFRWIKTIITIIVIIAFANWLVVNTIVETYPIFDTVAVFTYFGVLLGFAITIYTFGLSMAENIKNGINRLQRASSDEKKIMIESIVSGFHEIKQDIYAIFISMIIVIGGSIAKNIINPFGWTVEKWQVPETLNLGLFFVSTYCMYDIITTLFNLSEINLTLLSNSETL